MEKDIIIEGLKLHYSDSGNAAGKPIVIMHGWGCNLHTVESIARILEPGMRVLNVDLPGHGASDEPSSIWGVEDYTHLIEKFIFLQPQVVMAGHIQKEFHLRCLFT